MSEKHGTEKLKGVIATVKHGVIAVTQAIAKDGFQVDDLLAPMDSKQFMDGARNLLKDVRAAAEEAVDLDFMEGFEMANHLRGVYKDVKTEVVIALQKIKAQKS